MKSMFALCVALVLAVTPLVRAAAYSPDAPRFTNATLEQTEQSMLEGLQTDNPYVLATIAVTVKDLKSLYPNHSFSSMIIPLMRVVRDRELADFARTTAAITLHDLRSTRGDYIIEQMVTFGGNEKLKHVCEWLTYYRLLEKHTQSTVGNILSAMRTTIPFSEDL